MATLPLPLVPLAGDVAVTAAGRLDRGRDLDAEVGATPDTLRRWGMISGDLVVGLARPCRGVSLGTWTIPAVINWCFWAYALLGLSLPRGVRLVTWTILAVN
jgi:hypothetical protein